MKISECISKSHIKLWCLNPEDEVNVEWVDAKNFLTPNRFDLAIKIYYIECRERGVGLEFAKHLYSEHIKIWNGGIEYGHPEKNSIEKYFQAFDNLIDNVKRNGFDENISVVPVSDGILLNGAHRVAVGIYFKLKIPTFNVPNIYETYNYNFFKNIGFKTEFLDFASRIFMKYSDNCHIAFLWPKAVASKKFAEGEKLFLKNNNLLYKKEVFFNRNGFKQLSIHLYGHQGWTGGFESKYKNLDGLVDLYYKPAKTNIYVFVNLKNDEMIEIKKQVRDFFGVGNASMHSADDKEESLETAKMVLNQNSIDLLNNGDITKFYEFDKLLMQYKKDLKINGESEKYCVESGAVLAIYGIRDTRDIDYISLSDKQNCEMINYDNHNNSYPKSQLEERILNPQKYFYCFGVKFASLKETLDIKIKRNGLKDQEDICAIKRVIAQIDKNNSNNRIIKKELKKQKKVELQFKYNEIKMLNGKLIAFLWAIKNLWKFL